MKLRYWLVLLLFALVACNAFGLTSKATPDTTQVSEIAPFQPSATPALTSLPVPTIGKLAIEGSDGNIYVLSSDRGLKQITSDGTASLDPAKGVHYSQPTWAAQGWLSFVRIDALGDGSSRTNVLALPPDMEGMVSVLEGSPNSYVYGYWSPRQCTAGTDCAQFAYLLEHGNGLELHLADFIGTGLKSEATVGLGSPFYFSWSPDGKALIWHRDDRDLIIYDAVKRKISQRLGDNSGVFQAPIWSPSDARILFATLRGGQNQVTIGDGESRDYIDEGFNAPLFLSWASDGMHIAYAHGEYPLTGLTVADDKGQNRKAVGNFVDNIVAFFWSPDGTRLAVATVETGTGTLPQATTPQRFARRLPQSAPLVALVWWVVDVQSNKVARLASFIPTPEEFYMLRYFDQFAQSHRMWSPDSRFIVYAELTDGQHSGEISLLDASEPGKAAYHLMAGNQAVFSFGE